MNFCDALFALVMSYCKRKYQLVKKISDGISRIQPTFAAKTSTIHGEHMSFILTELKTIIAQIWKFLPVKFEFCYNLKNKLK